MTVGGTLTVGTGGVTDTGNLDGQLGQTCTDSGTVTVNSGGTLTDSGTLTVGTGTRPIAAP